MITETIPTRFRGPPGSGNGGWTCGTVARHLSGPAAEVTLRRPPPLEVEMEIVVAGDSARLEEDGQVVAEGRVVDGVDAEFVVVSLEEAMAASAAFGGYREHYFPSCFTCGPDRESGDGLRVLAGPVAGRDGIVASPWDTPVDLIGPDGSVDPRAVWAALDCPGAWANFTRSYEPMVLGRLTAELLAPVPAGERLVVTGSAEGRDGRKARASSAVLGGDGRPLAIAHSVWIVLDSGEAERFAVAD
jgi:hypothetical protein